MPVFIIHKDGAYNLFSTIVDAPYYESALTLDQLKYLAERDGWTASLPERLERVHATGCSALSGMTLLECIECNRAGEKESELEPGEFIRRYLTLAKPERS